MELAAWIAAHGRDLAIAASVGIAAAVVLEAARRLFGRFLGRLARDRTWTGVVRIIANLRHVSTLWIALIAAYPAVRLAPMPEELRRDVSRTLLTLLLLSLGIAAIGAVRRLAQLAGKRFGVHRTAQRVAIVVIAGGVGAVTVLGVLNVWGAPALPLIVILALAGVLAALALRDVIPAVAAAFQVAAFHDLSRGDYVKLDTGEEGTIEEISWRDVVIRPVDGSRVRIPSAKLVRATVVNYGRAYRRAEAPLRFQVRSHIRELTGLRARNLAELRDCLEAAPDNSIYYHTHQYLEEHQYLTPTPANAFSEWVGDALGNASVAESLAAIDVLQAPALDALRRRLIAVVDEAVRNGKDTRTAEPGHELHFLKSITFITPCPYEAHNLRELAGVVRRLSLGSLYFHLFEARLLGGAMAVFDIASWLRREVDQPELAAEIGRLNPYDFTLEGLRASLVARIEGKLA